VWAEGHSSRRGVREAQRVIWTGMQRNGSWECLMCGQLGRKTQAPSTLKTSSSVVHSTHSMLCDAWRWSRVA
jgi:hypothetical protein